MSEPAFLSFCGTPADFIDLVAEEWNFRYGNMTTQEVLGEDLRPYEETRCVTGGWSENEELQSHLANTMFHVMFWESSHRGGLTVYRVPQEWLEADGSWGQIGG